MGVAGEILCQEKDRIPGDGDVGIDEEVVRDLLDGKCLGQKKGSGGCKWGCNHHLGALSV